MTELDRTDTDHSAALADYAASLTFGGVPENAVSAARQCLIDAVACAIHGSRFEWSRIAAETASCASGDVAVPGTAIVTDAAKAALCSGVFAHAFELDSLRKPGAGVHPGATVALPALMVAQEQKSTGEELLAAILAGTEVLFRIGAASLHSAERRGFHAPGITGVYGAAAAASRLMKLTPRQTLHAFGLAGSMGGGLLRFAASGTGGMVKRLHLGRAAENGILAARLAAAGFEGPTQILEGRFGTLDAYCEKRDLALLSARLGAGYEIENICIKRYACHVTAQAPVQLLGDWMEEHRFGGEDVASIALDVPEKIFSHHAEKHPGDMALAQYSVPFMLAFSAFFDLDDPSTLTDENIADKRVHELADRIILKTDTRLEGWAVRMRASLRGGREIAGEARSFAGCPETPLTDAELDARFGRLTASLPPNQTEALREELFDVRAIGNVAELPLGLATTDKRCDGSRTKEGSR